MKLQSMLLTTALFAATIGQAQKNESSVYLRAGVNLANVSIKDNGTIDEANMLPSFQVGMQGDIPVTSFLSLQPGILFTGKGSKTQMGNTTDANYYRATSNPYYIEVPMNITFKLPLNKESKFFAGAGGYAAMGIAGNRKADGKIFGVAFSNKERIDFSNDDPTTSGEEGAGFGIMKRFDFGLTGTAGFEGNAIVVAANYGLGLAKLQSGTTNGTDNNNKHRVLSITIGFKL